ncbi:MAG: DNA-binding protein [Alphaproteobacteria bacterium]|nr:DNA-binding protein [Alphaproteobacteria bacterium]MPY81525.1 DNA-binding protein [Actinophytocola sp.]
MPGQLQTAEYAHALLTAITEHHETRNDVDEAVAARMDRQRILQEPGHRFVFIVEEAALRYCVGGADVMTGQLEHLRSAMSLPSVALLVVPFTVPRRQWALENFTIYDGAHVRVELLSAQVNITAPREVAWYVKAFRTLVESAVTGAKARQFMATAADTFT